MNGFPPYCIDCGKGECFLEGTYNAVLAGKNVGTVQVIKEGLYCRFRCRCKLEDDVCRLMVSCGDKQENLGVLVPSGEGFYLETKIPAKRLGQGKPVFSVIPNRAVLTGKFIPISPEEPFAYIARLKEAYLVTRNGQQGIVIRENAGR